MTSLAAGGHIDDWSMEDNKEVFERDGERRTVPLVPEPDLGPDETGLECDRWDATFQRITPEEVDSRFPV